MKKSIMILKLKKYEKCWLIRGKITITLKLMETISVICHGFLLLLLFHMCRLNTFVFKATRTEY